MIPSSMGVRLAALASRKDLIDLDQWLSNQLNKYKDNFFEVLFIEVIVDCSESWKQWYIFEFGNRMYADLIKNFRSVSSS